MATDRDEQFYMLLGFWLGVSAIASPDIQAYSRYLFVPLQ
jgi:hypothetical protein